ncbi:hypothetical protein [Herbaspirillum seropedicae]|uniref:hypothetical protein n=1 Tax=Herbaspirillum seropedicae TaxID=964 RepID=UPI003D98974E
MKLILSWERSIDGPVPRCISDLVNKDGIDLLACLLTDDGGQSLSDTLPWLDEGVNRINLVKDASVDIIDWSRDAWGVELTIEQAKIYSLYDDDCFEVLQLRNFEKALLAWRNFIQLKPEFRSDKTIEI